MADDEVCGCYVAGLDNVGGDHAKICLLGPALDEAESLLAALREAEAQRDEAQQGWAWALTERNRDRGRAEAAEAQRDEMAAAWEAGSGREIAELEAVIRQAANTTNAERGRAEAAERKVNAKGRALASAGDRIHELYAQVGAAERKVDEYRQALQVALDHVLELEEAWARGALDEHDGRGGERSNRNAQVRVALRDALRVEQPRGGLNEKCPTHGNEHPAYLCPVAEPEWEGAER